MPTTPPADLVGVGLNATDTLIPLAHYPVRGSKVEYHHAAVLPGGQVATVVVACAHWGMHSRYVGKLGEDAAAALHRAEFDRAGVETRIITAPGANSPQSLILVDADGERTVLNRRDHRLVLQPAELQQSWITSARALHVDGYDTAAATCAAQWARAAGVPVIADLDERYPGVEELLASVDYPIVSRDFPSRLMPEFSAADLKPALQAMRQRYNSKLTAVTLGEEGVLAWDGRAFHHASAYRVPVVDTTGAGDIFHAGFIYGLLQNWPLARRLDFACAAAALNCTGQGARGHIAPIHEIEHLMATGAHYTTPALTEA